MPLMKAPVNGEYVGVDSVAVNDGTGQRFDYDRLKQIENTLSDQAYQEQLLTHGLNVINSDQPSPMKVEFYGNTLVNLRGSGHSTEKSFVGTGEVLAVKDYGISDYGDGYYLFAIDVKGSVTGTVLLSEKDSTGNTLKNNTFSIDTNYKTIYVKVSAPNVKHIRLATGIGFTGTLNYKNERTYKSSAEIYNKIGVSLTDADVERLFPYVDSVQHVRNPVMKVSGKNLFDGEIEYGSFSWSNGIGISDTTVLRSVNFIDVVPSSTLTFKSHSTNPSKYDVCYVFEYDSDKNFIKYNPTPTTVQLSPNARYIRFRTQSNGTDGYILPPIEDIKIQIELGDKATPYTPYNPSYLYAETTLAGNSSKKDILYRNFDKGRWEVRRNWKTDVVLDGSNNWQPSSNYEGYKSVNILLVDGTGRSEIITKFDGKPLTPSNSLSTSTGDCSQLGYDNKLYITIYNSDSGWTQAMTPTTDLIKSYFNGYLYKGDGTNHSWVSKVDGVTPPAENTLAFVSNPANMPEGYTPYKLTYQLANPVTEVEGIDFPIVEGDVSVQGSAHVEVSEGVIVREKANPLLSGEYYYINISNAETTHLNHRVKNIVSVFNNGKEDNKWEIKGYSLSSDVNAVGNNFIRVLKSSYNGTDVIEVTYEPLEKHNFTANLNEVKATFNKSLKDAVRDNITKVTDIATDVSILDRQVYDMLVRLKTLEQV